MHAAMAVLERTQADAVESRKDELRAAIDEAESLVTAQAAWQAEVRAARAAAAEGHAAAAAAEARLATLAAEVEQERTLQRPPLNLGPCPQP